MRVCLGRFERLFDKHTIFSGVTCTDAHVTFTGMLVVCAGLVFGTVIVAESLNIEPILAPFIEAA